MQRLVEMINYEEEKEIIFAEVERNALKLSLHPKGNFVLLILIQMFATSPKFDLIVFQLLDHI